VQPAQHFRLVLLIPTGNQDQPLLGPGAGFRGGRAGDRLGGGGRGLPGGAQLVRDGRRQLQQAVVELLLRLGQAGQLGDGVNAEEQDRASSSVTSRTSTSTSIWRSRSPSSALERLQGGTTRYTKNTKKSGEQLTRHRPARLSPFQVQLLLYPPCGIKGDVIDLWAHLKGLKLRHAALDLVQVFNLEPAPRTEMYR
jgi:hypothetical protein